MLPKITQPIFKLTIPTSKKTIKYRPFVCKEEKYLLIAQEGNDTEDIINAIKQLITNCVVDEIDVDKLSTIDLEYIFLKIRAKSVNNIVELKYRDNEDNKLYSFSVNIDEIEPQFTKGHTNKIQITDTVGVIMKYPTTDIALSIISKEGEFSLNSFIAGCIDSIWDENSVYPAIEYTEQELNDFIGGLLVDQRDKVLEFFSTMPKLSYTISYTNENGKKVDIVLEGIKDFFP